jgi:hypothetical protein
VQRSYLATTADFTRKPGEVSLDVPSIV